MTSELEQKDANYLAEYRNKNPWGLTVSIDLKNCNKDSMVDAEYIKQFVKDLCELIDMKRFGDTTVVNFGTNEKVSGFSMTQLIETSLISAHFANASRAIYLDVFSCKAFPPYKVAEFAKERFEASEYGININFRY
ncbi:MAG: S-adenosylmethionine decarboxylase [Candidatus Paceibacterota bacterium]|nr:S-adenosylmethionine decarboxylase [Candidatus Paceibacterota bacterium]MDD4999205.1 S-adenosylmethionine decarboxylase [Candidatus Paceibacterota bacterium]MDD5545339.1 S-adenosylmethionine decarboxylase [Candidatus Paceibacterota bacterium]